MFITQINYQPDGVIVGSCRGGHPFWRYDPEDGDQGSVENLGNPWRQLEDGACDSGRALLLGLDGLLYYWVTTEVGGDMNLIRMNMETGEREDFGLGHIEGKSLGTWTGCGVVGPDGRMYWGDSGYETPRLIVFDPRLLSDQPNPIEAEIDLPEKPPAAGSPISVHPVDASWSHPYVDKEHLKAIPVCGSAAPHGSSAITSLACDPRGTVFAVTSGRSCRLIAYDPESADDSTVLLHDTGIAGSAYHSLAISPDHRVFSAVDPSQPGIPAPVYRVHLATDGEASVDRIGSVPEGVRTMIGDWSRGRLHLLTGDRKSVV